MSHSTLGETSLQCGDVYKYNNGPIVEILKMRSFNLRHTHVLVECIQRDENYACVVGFHNKKTQAATGICFQSALNTNVAITNLNRHIATTLPTTATARSKCTIPLGFRYWIDAAYFFGSYMFVRRPSSNIWIELEQKLREYKCL